MEQWLSSFIVKPCERSWPGNEATVHQHILVLFPDHSLPTHDGKLGGAEEHSLVITALSQRELAATFIDSEGSTDSVSSSGSVGMW